MDTHELAQPDPDTTPALGHSRSHVLAVLQDAATALTVGDVATLVHLHPNTVRFHLDALTQAGLVQRHAEDRTQPGRPRVLYTAHPHTTRAGRRSYRLLAEILTSYLAAATPQPTQAALHAGRAWGSYLAERPPPFRRLDAATATRQLVHTLDAIGFAPETATASHPRQVLLHHCPFRETAEEHREVVCAIHLGLMQGLLTELDAPVQATRLDPFVEPNLCVTHLTPRGATAPAESRPPD